MTLVVAGCFCCNSCHKWESRETPYVHPPPVPLPLQPPPMLMPEQRTEGVRLSTQGGRLSITLSALPCSLHKRETHKHAGAHK